MKNGLDEIREILYPLTKRAYFVGGSVRDLFLNQKSKDLDIEIYDIEPNKFSKLMSSIGAIGVGKSFFVYKFKGLDLSLPRSENKISKGHQGFKVSYCNDEKKASSRRDFTINAMMKNIFTNEILDFWNGKKDLQLGLLRYINKNAFLEDPLRAFRAISFASRFAFLIEKNTEKLIKQMPIEELSQTRVFWELEKIFLSEYPHIGLLYLHKFGFLKKILNTNYDESKIMPIALKIYEASIWANKENRPFYFLYILLNELKLDIKKTLKYLQAPNIYFKALKTKYFNHINDEEMLELSLEMPLRYWAGLTNEDLIKKAKKYGILENVFKSKIKSQDIINDGFIGAEISNEIKKRQKQEIKQFIKDNT